MMSRKKTIIIRNEVISASAGTGKTYQLVNRYLKLLAAGVEPETIVALTFTRNAAAEIFDRVIGRLSLIIRKPEILRSAEYEEIGLSEMDRQGIEEMLRRLLLKIHLLQIGTFDSFFVRIIKTFSFEFGLSGDFEIIDDVLVQQSKRKVMKSILWNSGFADKTMRGEFLEEFKNATFGREEKKLTALFNDFVDEYHYKFLLAPEAVKWGDKDRIWPDSSVIFADGIDPAAEADRLENLAGGLNLNENQRKKFLEFIQTARDFKPDSVFESDNSFIKNLFEIYSELETGTARLKLITRNRVELGKNECECILRLLRHMMKCQITAQLHKTEGIYKLISRYEERYNHMIRQSGKLTFADIPFVLSANAGLDSNSCLLTGNPDFAESRLYIDYRLDSKFNHWLIDEFQDTSYQQWMIIKNLIDEIIQDSSGRRSFFYVGDVKQSIYGWRQGEPGLFRSIYESYRAYSDIELKKLSRSFRSNSEIIGTVNKVFGNIKNISELRENVLNRWDWEEHEPKNDSSGNPVSGGYATLLRINGEKMRPEDIIEVKSKIIAEKIAEISPFERGLSVAVLCLKNDTARLMAELLQSRGIKVAIEGQFKLTDNPLVNAIVSLAKFAEHPADSFAWQHLMMTPFRDLLKSEGEACKEVLCDIYDNGFAYFIRKWGTRLRNEAGVVFDEFGDRRFNQFISAAQSYDSTGEKGCLDFIDYIEGYEIPGESADDAVQILTIHKAKGLQYDIVFLPEIKSNVITKTDVSGIKVKKNDDLSADWLIFMPNRIIAEAEPVLNGLVESLDNDSCYESLCVLYVAMTRAKEALYMIANPPPKTESESFYLENILLKTLCPGGGVALQDELECLYESGLPDWFKKKPMEKSKEDFIEQEKDLDIRFDDAFESVTPSGSEERLVSAGAVFEGFSSAAMKTGSAVHELLERVEWIDNAEPESICSTWKKESDYPVKTADTAIEIFLKSMKLQELRDLLKRPAGGFELWRERRFEIAVDKTWLNGEFDRVTLLKNSSGAIMDAVILDYKTDNINSDEELQRALLTYSPQMKHYRRALSFLVKLPVDRIRLELAFIRIGKICQVD